MAVPARLHGGSCHVVGPPNGFPSPTPRKACPLFDRAPPFDLEAEISVLGSIMLLPDVCDDVALLLRADDFHDDAHRKIYEHMLEMHEHGRKLDHLLLVDKLKSAGDFESIGGRPTWGRFCTPCRTPPMRCITPRSCSRRPLSGG